MRICLFEDSGVGLLEPLTSTRAAFELRCGALTLGQRQARLFAGAALGALVRPELAGLCRLSNPQLAVNDPTWLAEESAGPLVLVNARWLAPSQWAVSLEEPGVGLVGEQLAWVVLPAGADGDLSWLALSRRLEAWQQQLPARPAGGRLITYPWELIEHNGQALEQDYADWASRGVPQGMGANVLGPPERLRVEPTAQIEPLVLIDTRAGPVLLEAGVLVQAGSRLEGPCYLGKDTQVLGARLRGSSIGPQCRLGGEVECSLLQGHANKAHQGFLGHSYLGEWVNLGAGTHTSDLRTDYGEVTLRLAGQVVSTGLLKVGSFVGDHTRTCLNSLFNTGSLVGPFAQLLCPSALLPRQVPAFCQVSPTGMQERTDLRQMFATAEVVLSRRGQQWTPTHAEFFLELYERTQPQRRLLLREAELRRLRRVM